MTVTEEPVAPATVAQRGAGGPTRPTSEWAPTPLKSDSESRLRLGLRSYWDLRKTPYGLMPIVLLAAISVFQRFDNELFINGAPEIIKALGLNVSSIIGIVVFIGFLGGFAALALGYYADRHGRVPILAIGTMISGIGAMVSGWGRTNLRMGSARVLDSASNQAADVPSFSLVADYYPLETRGRVFAVLGGVIRFAAVVSLPLAGVLIVNLGVKTSFLIAGAPIFVLGLVVFRLKEPIRGYFERRAAGAPEEVAIVEDEPKSFGEAWRTTFAVRTVRRLFVADCVASLADPLGLFIVFLLSERYGLDAAHRGLVLAIPTAAAIAGGLLGGNLLDDASRRNPGGMLTVVGFFRLIGATAVVILALQPNIVVLVAGLSLAFFGNALVGPASNAIYTQVIPPEVRSEAVQITNLSSTPGFLFGFPIASILYATHGYSTLFGAAVPCLALSAFIAASAGRFFDIDRRNQLAGSVAAEDWRRAKAAGDDKLLVCRQVDVAYNGVQVLFGVDLDVHDGELIALLGTNGAGKSTLLRAISGTQEASGGAILFDGREITHMPPHETAARGIIHMPGGRGIFPELTVRENLLLGTWLSTDPVKVQAKLAEVFEIFPDLLARSASVAGVLSGGQQQQLSLAQAFLAEPKLLMIDELSLGLSPAVVGQLIEVVKEIHRRGVTIIVVEQSVNVALTLANRAVFMEKGEVRFSGPTAELLARPDILRSIYVKGTGGQLTSSATAASARSRRVHELDQAHAILQVSGVSKSFGGIVALSDVDLTLREGEVLGLIGPNGSGKTTLFEIISGFLTPDRGRIRFEGVDVTELSPEERSRRRLIRRFQDARLFPSLSVEETILIALEHRLGVRSALLGAAAFPSARRAESRLRGQAEKLIELLDLHAYRDKFVKELSTGLRRIVDLACVLAAEPKVLLLDEPSSGIAQAEAESLGPLLRRVRFETGCSILIIEHDMPLISNVADELIALDQGQVVIRGTADQVLNDERVVASYLGGSEEAIHRSGNRSRSLL